MIVDITDLNFTNLSFSKHYDSTREYRARSIYKEKKVKINKVEKLEENNKEVCNVFSTVYGNYDNYDIYINIENSTVTKSTCTCPDYEKGNVCKHILATCMEIIDPQSASTKEGVAKLIEKERKLQEELRKKIQEENKKRDYERKYHNALGLLKEYKMNGHYEGNVFYAHKYSESADELDVYKVYNEVKNDIENNNSNSEFLTDLKIEPKITLDDDEYISVTYKVGKTKMYIVKDIFDFAEAFSKGDNIEYGKKCIFNARIENFIESDKELLNNLLDYANTIGARRKYEYSYSSYGYHGRDIKRSVILFGNKIY